MFVVNYGQDLDKQKQKKKAKKREKYKTTNGVTRVKLILPLRSKTMWIHPKIVSHHKHQRHLAFNPSTKSHPT